MKSKFLLFLFFISVLIFPSCKKGTDDPLFSLRTRTGRLSGKWELTKGEWQNADTTIVINNGKQVESYPQSISDSLPTSINFNFESNGNYRIESNYNYPDGFYGPGSIAFEFSTLERGIWNFAGGKNDIPSKSQILLIKEYSEEKNSIGGANVEALEFENPTNGFIYNIQELRNDKMVLNYNTTFNSEDGAEIRTANLEFRKL